MLTERLSVPLIAVFVLSFNEAAVAQEEAPPPPAPAAAETQTDVEPTELLDPNLRLILERDWGPVGRDDPGFTDGGNLTVLSVPDACAVYMASVEEIRQAEQLGGGEVAVEDVVFRDDHFLGLTPLTVAASTGEHVLAVRATKRLDGFDLGCVRKVTTDIITGGRRHAYHLYPLRKRAGQYQCFVANFTGPSTTLDEIGADLLARGTFWIDEEMLATALAAQSKASEDSREALAERLNKVGVVFFRADNQDYLAKITVLGGEYQLDVQAVE